jgi:hypothetical protein
MTQMARGGIGENSFPHKCERAPCTPGGRGAAELCILTLKLLSESLGRYEHVI